MAFVLDDEENRQVEPFEITGREISESKPEEKPLPLPPKAQAEMNRRVGRPTKYNPEVADFILFKIMTTTTGLRAICEEAGIDYATMRLWLIKHPEFSTLYVRAKQVQADNMAEDALRVSRETVNENDMAAVQMKRLEVDTLKWLASKLYPKVYGEKQLIEAEVKQTTSVNNEQFGQIMQEIRQIGKKPANDGYEQAEVVE